MKGQKLAISNDKQIKILGICHILYAPIVIVKFLFFIWLPMMIAVTAEFLLPVHTSHILEVIVYMPALSIFYVVHSLVGGIGVLSYKPWARCYLIIFAFFNLPIFPLGTALGIYSLKVLFNSNVKDLFISRTDTT